MVKILVIDDTRTFPEAMLHCRNYKDGLNALITGKWDVLYLDHDLGDFRNNEEKTGYDIACFLESNPQYLPSEVRVVSSNPVGVNRINAALKKAYERKVQYEKV